MNTVLLLQIAIIILVSMVLQRLSLSLGAPSLLHFPSRLHFPLSALPSPTPASTHTMCKGKRPPSVIYCHTYYVYGKTALEWCFCLHIDEYSALLAIFPSMCSKNMPTTLVYCYTYYV